MKIGILTGEEFAFGSYGGFGFVARKTASLLRHLGHDVCIMDVSSRYGRSPTSLEEGIPVFFLVDKRISLGPIDELNIAKNFVKKFSLDVIISVSLYVCGKWSYYFKLACPKLKSLIWFQDVRTNDDWRKIFNNSFFWLDTRSKYLPVFLLHERFRRFLRKKGMEKADGLITQAELMRHKVKQVYNTENMKLVPNPIPITNDGDIKKQSKPLVIFLGRLDPIKRPWLFAEIAKQLPDIQFLTLGVTHFPENMNPIIERYKKIKNLKFLGLVLGKNKADILRRAWILVNTSVYESLPVSFLEALSYKMTILSCHNPDNITSNYGFYTGEALGDGYDAIPKFIDGVQFLLSNNRWLEKGEKGYEFVKNFADERKIAKKLDQIICNL